MECFSRNIYYSWSYVFFFFLLLLHLSIIMIWSNAPLELIPNVSNYHELLLGRRACMHRLHSKGNGIMALINLKLHLNLCSSGNFHFEQQYAFSQGILGAIYKPCGSFFGLVFWPPPSPMSPMWIVLLHRLC